ncbi:hypothetical protein [uncultured Thiodictyon sp.]|uniref:hypothetical protein n=1 Tax=uncultured Thiodictyon sp. TaxID=1846217 RepID=UPI0025D0E69C|nr:hypothetical protein [uncultured Thiodictyon sp.]
MSDHGALDQVQPRTAGPRGCDLLELARMIGAGRAALHLRPAVTDPDLAAGPGAAGGDP